MSQLLVNDTILLSFNKLSTVSYQFNLKLISDEFIGVKMTRGIIQHFKENHNDDPCDD